MRLTSLKSVLSLVFAATLLVGCESASTVPEEPVVAPVVQEAPAYKEPGLSAEELAAREAAEAERRAQAALREIRTFYFDFDQATVKTESRAPLMAHAAFLAANPSVKVRIEGHADERGTKEYNIALGERRAKAVERFLVINGVSASQIQIISYGEERPADAGSNEAAWAKNRRAYLEYL